jgi:hypothetical protein
VPEPHYKNMPEIAVELLASILYIQKVSCSNLCPETGYPTCGLCGSPRSLQAKASTAALNQNMATFVHLERHIFRPYSHFAQHHSQHS